MKAVRRLEDFGLRQIVSADERLQQYRLDAKALPKAKKAAFWLEIFASDKEVGELAGVVERKYPRRGR